MKSGKVYYRDIFAGTLTKDVDGYTFRYDEGYLDNVFIHRPISSN